MRMTFPGNEKRPLGNSSTTLLPVYATFHSVTEVHIRPIYHGRHGILHFCQCFSILIFLIFLGFSILTNHVHHIIIPFIIVIVTIKIKV